MLTEAIDLRGGKTAWAESAWAIPSSDVLPTAIVDVAIVGGGISGAILAERLSAQGLHTLVLDRRPPACGSTAASTAQVMWAMDVPLTELAANLGETEAARRWRRVHGAVRAFRERIGALGLDASLQECPTVYLQGERLDADGLRTETALHREHGLPSRFLDAAALAERFGICPRAGIVSDGGFAIDPVELTHGLLAKARARDTQICYPVDVTSLTEGAGAVELDLADGQRVVARRVILASGYERAPMFLPMAFRLSSTFVMATPPGTARLWNESAMIWEAADPYLYVRADTAGRIIAGGEDEDLVDPILRDGLIGSKAGTIRAKLQALLQREDLIIDRAWAATFGTSPDGLPAIGRAAHHTRVWLAAGYGGNGIAFSALAAELLSREIAGAPDADAGCFNPYRF